jgi:hypothetical protein
MQPYKALFSNDVRRVTRNGTHESTCEAHKKLKRTHILRILLVLGEE